MRFRKSRSKRAPRRPRYQTTIERLEDRALLTASWNNYGGNAQHTEVAQVAAQPLNQLLWSTPLDLAPWGAVHYGDPVFTPGSTVIVPVKITWSGQNQNSQNFYIEGLNDTTGAVEWTSALTGSVTAASNAGPIVITTGTTTGLTTGDSVTVGGVNGNTASNGTFTITVLNSTQFQLNGTTGNAAYTSGGAWAYNPNGASYIAPTYNWLEPVQPVYDPVTDRVYFPGPGGTLDYIAHPDNPGSSTPTVVQEAFYGLTNYTANESAYNSSIYINTGLMVDGSGNVYFGFTETGTNPSGINDGGFVRITPTGTATYTNAYAAVGQTNDGNWNPSLGQTPALSNDGSTVYFGVNDSGYSLNVNNESNSYLVALNSTTLAGQDSVHLIDPGTGLGAMLIDESTASPMVAPDNTVFLGVFPNINTYNGSRGFLLHFSGNLQTEYTPGAFGWDDTPSIIPTSMVPSYTGSSPYLILTKYNNYANAEVGEPYGGNGVNQIAILDPYNTQLDPNYDANSSLQVMKQVMTMQSPSPDIPNAEAGDPDAVREWCTNGTVVDPATDSVYINNEDGYTYQWNLGTGLVTNAVQVTSGVGVPYTPTAIAPNGVIFSDNGGTLFALGGYSNYTMTTVSSADPVVVGNTVTLTTNLASTDSGPKPTGTVTYTYYQGANNPLNYDTTPVTIGTANVVNGVASIQVSGLVASHYHIYAEYSGDSNYSTGQTILVLPVLGQVSTTVTSSSPNPANPGADVTFTVTVTPNGNVANGATSGATDFVPIGTVTLYDNGTALRTVSLNNLENETNPSTTNTATYTAPGLELVGGTNAITAVYNGDQNFTSGTSPIANEYIPLVINPGTQNGAVGDSVSLQLQAFGLPPGDSWTFSATGLPSGLSINTSTGAITGTITGSASTYSVSVSAADGTKASSASQNFTWNVSALSVTTTTLVASSANTTYGQNETLTATVTSHAGSPNAGTVTFYDGTTSLGTVPISNGTAQFSTTTLTAGVHVLTATYSGDGGVEFAGSSSVLSLSSVIQTVAGNGAQGNSGTGNQATLAELNGPQGVAVDSAGNLYIADEQNDIVEKVNAQTHVITTIAGTGVFGFNGNGIPATSAELDAPVAVAVDSAGDVFIADDQNDMVREVSAATGLISTVAGDGGYGYNGDGIAATSATLASPVSIALDSAGNLYIADFGNHRIREVSKATGLISTIAGTGTAGYNGDGIAATSAELNYPDAVVLDAAGDVFISDSHNNRVREVNKSTGLISTVAGTGTAGYNGDGIAATSAELNGPGGLAIDASGNLFIADTSNVRVREVSAATGLINTVVGTGTTGYNGDNIAAGSAELSTPEGLAIDSVGNLYIADYSNWRIREVAGGYAVVGVSPLVVNPGTQNNAVGDTVSLQVQASGLPTGDSWTYSDTGLPAGLSINTSTGLITGTITGSASTYSATVTAADGTKASASQTFTWNVSVLSETNPGTQTNGVGDSVSLQIQDSGLPSGDTWSYSATGLPSGLSISPTTGLITGTITGTPNTYSASVTASDGQGASASQNFTWKVFDRPAIAAPSSASVTENFALTFSSVSGNEITVTDGSAGGNPDSMTVSASNGTLTLGSTTGLTLTQGGYGTGSFTVTGTIGNLNAALNGLTYQPNVNYVGPDTLAVSLTDSVDTLTGSGNVAVTVNAVGPPSIAAPSTATVSENGSLVFSPGNGNAISITDNGAGSNADTATLSVSNGTLTLGSTIGLIFTSGSNGSASFSVKGTVSNLNAALNGLKYTPTANYVGSDSLSILVSDSGDSKSGSTSVAINVSPLAPAIGAPSTALVPENWFIDFSTGNNSAITLTDAGPGADSLTLSVSHGTLTLATTTGLTFTTGSNGLASFTATGTVANLNAALSNGLTYTPTPAYSGSDTLAVSLTDTGDSLSASKNIAITVQAPAPPSISAPASASVIQNGSLVFSSGNGNLISVADAGAGSGSDSLTLAVSHGTLTFSNTAGLTFTTGSNGSASFTVTGTIVVLNQDLNGLTYAPTAGYSGSDSLAISIADAADNESASKSVSLTINSSSPPTISAPGSASVVLNGSLVFSSANHNAITVADSGPGSGSDSLMLTVTHGTVTLSTTSGLTITGGANGSATITVTGSVASLNAALSGLTYKPTTGYTGSDSLAISLKDSVDNLSASANVALSVNNSPPAITAPASGAVVITSSLVFSTANNNAISVADVNAGSSVEPLTLTSTDGTLTLGSTTGITITSGANKSASMTINGTLANLNAALSGLTFTPAAVGSGTVVLSYTDVGNGQMATATINITVSKSGFKLVQGLPVSPPSSPAVTRASSVSAPTGGGTTTPAVTLTTANDTTDDNSLPPDALTQWQGLAAAVEMLIG
jgi:trimeric autotransporter adhesin